MWKKVVLGVLGVVVAAVVVVLGLAMTQPDTFRVERHAVIHAPADAIFANLDDFHRWEAWSPWERLDPNLQRTYSGAPSGVGAAYGWQGNDDVGRGRMTITESEPGDHVTIRLEFIEPFEATNTTLLALRPASGGTEVRWSMEGPQTFIGKVMCVFVDMDAMVGKDFENGLSNLARVSEADTTAAN